MDPYKPGQRVKKLVFLQQCKDPETFRRLTRLEARTKLRQAMDIIQEAIFQPVNNIFYNKNAFGENSEKLSRTIMKQIIDAVVKGQNLYVPNDIDRYRDIFGIPSYLDDLLTPPHEWLHAVFQHKIVPFIKSDPRDISLTVTVGPGSDIPQFYPHDQEFYEKVFLPHKKNIVVVFQPVIHGTTEGFTESLKEMFLIQDTDILRTLPPVQLILEDFQERFGVPTESIEIEAPNIFTRIFQFSFETENELMFLFFDSEYLQTFESLIKNVSDRANKKILLCGIRDTACADVLFRDSTLYFNHFDRYIFTHGTSTRSKELKARLGQYSIDLKRIREDRAYHRSEQLRNSMIRTPTNEEAKGFPESRLCKRNIRQPRNDPYCVEGVTNEAIFWHHFGGTRKAKRRHRKTRKN